MSYNPWQHGSVEYAQERFSGLLGFRHTTTRQNPNRLSQASLERLRAIAEADATSEGRWTKLRVESTRPDGCRVTVRVRCSRQELAAWRREHRWRVAQSYEAMRQLAVTVPSEPPQRPTHHQWDGDTLNAQEALLLAGWQRGYLCQARAPR